MLTNLLSFPIAGWIFQGKICNETKTKKKLNEKLFNVFVSSKVWVWKHLCTKCVCVCICFFISHLIHKQKQLFIL